MVSSGYITLGSTRKYFKGDLGAPLGGPQNYHLLREGNSDNV